MICHVRVMMAEFIKFPNIVFQIGEQSDLSCESHDG